MVQLGQQIENQKLQAERVDKLVGQLRFQASYLSSLSASVAILTSFVSSSFQPVFNKL
jgi:hypothetical protein